MKKSFVVLTVIGFLVVWMVNNSISNSIVMSKADLKKMHHLAFTLQNRAPIDSSEYFLNSFSCKGCHGFDPSGFALVDGAGNDVNIYDDWSTSMMALSAVDPFWRAKVSHEITVNPGTADEAQTLCTGCHAPTGHYTAIYKGNLHYTIADFANDSLGIDGVNCSGCHAMSGVGLGSMFNGNIPYDTNNVIYGPYPAPVTGPMQLYEGMTPTHGLHTHEGRFCSPCHTLITNTVDLSGVPTGTTFVEQATFQEWMNSTFPANDTTCQTCHMPIIEDPVVIAVGDINLAPRVPFSQHYFAGANSFMVKLMKSNKLALNIDHPDSSFNSTLSQIDNMLKTQSVNMKINPVVYADQDTLYVDVAVQNKAGHKFPSGYPSRRAFVQLVVINSLNDTLFASGLFTPEGELKYPPLSWQPHYQMINDSLQTQVFEMVMGDVNGDKTTLLERAATHLKDNRLPPRGFTSAHYNYDTVEIISNAFSDVDFNRNGASEGTGRDITQFHIPLNGFVGTVNVYAKIYYQTIPPAWLTEMFSVSTPEIDDFKAMYLNESNLPILIDQDSVLNVITNDFISENLVEQIGLYPNPSSDGWFYIQSGNYEMFNIVVYDLSGRQIVTEKQLIQKNRAIVKIPYNTGTYLVKIKTIAGWITKKLIIT